jgi:methyl-accepting chemotaxis protein
MDLSLLSAAQALGADTVVTRPLRDPIALASDVAVLVSAVALTVLAVSLVGFLGQWRHAVKEIRLTVRQNLGPVSDRARSISDNVEFITQALRADVARLNASVKSLSDRLQQASDHMEARIDEFNALMEVVQGEAEDIFLDTAATVRGVREGARALGRSPGSADLTAPEGEGAGSVDEARDVPPSRSDREVVES